MFSVGIERKATPGCDGYRKATPGCDGLTLNQRDNPYVSMRRSKS